MLRLFHPIPDPEVILINTNRITLYHLKAGYDLASLDMPVLLSLKARDEFQITGPTHLCDCVCMCVCVCVCVVCVISVSLSNSASASVSLPVFASMLRSR